MTDTSSKDKTNPRRASSTVLNEDKLGVLVSVVIGILPYPSPTKRTSKIELMNLRECASNDVELGALPPSHVDFGGKYCLTDSTGANSLEELHIQHRSHEIKSYSPSQVHLHLGVNAFGDTLTTEKDNRRK